MSDDAIARAAEVIFDRIGWRVGASRAASDLADAGLLATPPTVQTVVIAPQADFDWSDDEAWSAAGVRMHRMILEARLIEALGLWRLGQITTVDLLNAHDAYLAAHPEVTPWPT